MRPSPLPAGLSSRAVRRGPRRTCSRAWGAWAAWQYQEEFCRDLFYAANTFWERQKRARLSLEEEQRRNEEAIVKVIGLTLETRPDCINAEELVRLRRSPSLGSVCTPASVARARTLGTVPSLRPRAFGAAGCVGARTQPKGRRVAA
jgi:hypothetical protein